MKVRGNEVATGPHGGAGDTQQKDIEQKEMIFSEYVKISSCQTRDVETEIENNLNTARCSVEYITEKEKMNQIDLNAARRNVEDQPNEIGEMSQEDTARRSVEILEGDPICLKTLATVMQQPSALASQRVFVGRQNLFSISRFFA